MSDVSLENAAVTQLSDAGLLAGESWEVIPTGVKRIEWQPGTYAIGTFTEIQTVDLGEENNHETAEQIVFTAPEGDLWATWPTYQLTTDLFNVGDFYRITCTGKIKTGNGQMLEFRVERRRSA